MIRLFVGLALPEDVRLRLVHLQDGVPGAKWVAPENLHLSLRFIGEVEEHFAGDIVVALARVRAPGFDVMLDGLGSFGARRRSQALWAAVQKKESLVELQGKVERALVGAGLEPEGRRFTPHVTLARLKRASTGTLGRFLAEKEPFHAGPFAVDRFILFSSFLSRNGAIYQAEEEFALEPAPLSAHPR